MAINVDAGEAFVEVRARRNKLQGDLRRARQDIASSIQSMGRSVRDAGASLTKSLTLPLVAAGAASVKFAADFEAQAKRVQATAGLTEEEIDRLGPAVEEVAKITGEGTQGIFQAFQLAVSGVLDFDESLALIQDTSKAAAAGFGNAAELVNTVTTAVDNFSDQNLTASEILDKLVNVSKNTQVQVDGMGNAFRRVSAFASQLGTDLDQSLAILSVVAERFGDTDRAGRAVAQMFNQLTTPTEQMATGIESVFSSVDEFHDLLEKDTIGALQELQRRLEANDKGLGEVFTSSQTAAAANQLLADSGERVLDVLEMQEGAAGSVQQAFDDSSSMIRDFSKVWESFKAALRPFGEAIGPVVIDVLQKLVRPIEIISEAFSNLSPRVQEFIVIGGLLVSALGPALFVLGQMAIALGALIGAFTAAVSGLIAFTVATFGLGPALVAGLGGALVTAAGLAIAFKDTVISEFNKFIEAFPIDEISDSFFRLANNIRGTLKILTLAFTTAFTDSTEEVESFTAAVSKGLGKTIVNALDFVNDKVEQFGSFVADNFGTIQNMFRTLFDTAKTILGLLGEFISGFVSVVGTIWQNLWVSFVAVVSKALPAVMDFVAKSLNVLRGFFGNFYQNVIAATVKWVNMMIGLFNLLVERIVQPGKFVEDVLGIDILPDLVPDVPLLEDQGFILDAAPISFERGLQTAADALRDFGEFGEGLSPTEQTESFREKLNQVFREFTEDRGDIPFPGEEAVAGGAAAAAEEPESLLTRMAKAFAEETVKQQEQRGLEFELARGGARVGRLEGGRIAIGSSEQLGQLRTDEAGRAAAAGAIISQTFNMQPGLEQTIRSILRNEASGIIKQKTIEALKEESRRSGGTITVRDGGEERTSTIQGLDETQSFETEESS